MSAPAIDVLAVVGSLRRGGDTATAVDLLAEAVHHLAAADGRAIRWETVALSDMRIEACLGCRACFDLGEDHCPRRDDLLPLRERILASEGVVLATPVYVSDVSGSMKTLIDRLAFTCHRPAFAGIGFCLLATTGSSPVGHAIRTLQGTVLSMGGSLSGTLGLSAGARMDARAMQARHGGAIARCAERFWSDLRAARARTPSFIPLMMFRIQQRAWSREPPGSLDHRYWADKGWLEPGCTWYLPHRAAWLKVAPARAVGGVLARIFAR